MSAKITGKVIVLPVKPFKTESKRILDLMIHSIYTHREIFLRELISNASDAIDKLYFQSLTDPKVGMSREDFTITLAADKVQRTLTVSDNGCGMTADDLENNLGTIAQSGTLRFKQEHDLDEDIDVIGQFGVGFYAAFMVAKRVAVVSRAYGSDTAWRWESEGADGYTLEPAEREAWGTDIILTLKDNEDEDNYDEFLEPYRLRAIVKKYSDYIRYPIQMQVERSRKVEGTEDEYESYLETETFNSMVPLWRKNKGDVTEEEYNGFYKDKFFDFEDPLKVLHNRVEGAVTYTSLLYIPAKPPYDYYTKEFEKGLQLYANGVLIMEKCGDLLPDYFGFVRGLVDSQDLSLNISREMLQHDRQLRVIRANLEKRIKGELSKMLQHERDKYETFFKSFGLQLKFGVYNEFGANKEQLKDLLLFHALGADKLVSLQEYVDGMGEGQPFIYYACGESVERIGQLPQIELVRDKGYDILCLTEDVDEFALKVLGEYGGKEFKSVAAGDLGLESEEEKQAAEQEALERQAMFDLMGEALGDRVKAVRLSKRLKTHPVCLTADGALSLEMERVLNAMPTDNKVKAERILEINADHPIYGTLCRLYDTDQDKLKAYADLLYTQAMLIEGMPIEDPVAFSNAVCGLMAGTEA